MRNITIEPSIQPGPEAGLEIHIETSVVSTWIALTDLVNGVPDWLWEEDDLGDLSDQERSEVTRQLLDKRFEAETLLQDTH